MTNTKNTNRASDIELRMAYDILYTDINRTKGFLSESALPLTQIFSNKNKYRLESAEFWILLNNANYLQEIKSLPITSSLIGLLAGTYYGNRQLIKQACVDGLLYNLMPTQQMLLAEWCKSKGFDYSSILNYISMASEYRVNLTGKTLDLQRTQRIKQSRYLKSAIAHIYIGESIMEEIPE